MKPGSMPIFTMRGCASEAMHRGCRGWAGWEQAKRLSNSGPGADVKATANLAGNFGNSMKLRSARGPWLDRPSNEQPLMLTLWPGTAATLWPGAALPLWPGSALTLCPDSALALWSSTALICMLTLWPGTALTLWPGYALTLWPSTALTLWPGTALTTSLNCTMFLHTD
eukprot:1158898-Pelagomonas_calceolata.AAC.8